MGKIISNQLTQVLSKFLHSAVLEVGEILDHNIFNHVQVGDNKRWIREEVQAERRRSILELVVEILHDVTHVQLGSDAVQVSQRQHWLLVEKTFLVEICEL